MEAVSKNLLLEGKIKYVKSYQFPFCKSLNNYDIIKKIGEGTYGIVFKAHEKSNPKNIVAIKKLIVENKKEGFPITALREIRILKALEHDNIVRLFEVCNCMPDGNTDPQLTTFSLVFEFCEYDLLMLIRNTNLDFNLAEIKSIMSQLFEGIYFIHSNNLVHRDLKPANILVTKDGIIKLADFGLARPVSPIPTKIKTLTPIVVTLWYRSPELLLGDCNYTSQIDMWSLGCIMAELWTKRAILRGNSEQLQLKLISELCGSITPDVWPGVQKYDLYKKLNLPKHYKNRVREKFPMIKRDENGIHLLENLLKLNPSTRLNAEKAINHNFLWIDPLPKSLQPKLANLKFYNVYETLRKANVNENGDYKW